MKMYNWYIIETELFEGKMIVQYYGREEGFECLVCGKGNNAYCFNRYYDQDQYETFSFGKEHMPKIIKELGKSDKQIFDSKENIEMYLKEEK